MAVRLRLKRMGRTNRAFFRLHVVDSRSPGDGRIIEQLGHYDPREQNKDKQLKLDRPRIEYWLSQGAQPSDTVAVMLRKNGIAKPMVKA